MNTPPNLGEGPGEETPDDRAAGVDRVQAAAELRRTSLAADPGRARRNAAFTAAGVAALLLCGFGLYSMKHGAASAPSSFQDKPKIDEDTSKSAPLDASRQRLPASMAGAASAPAASSAPVDPEEARRQAMLRERAATEAAARRQKELALLEARRKSAIFGADADGTGDAQGDAGGQPDADANGHGLNHRSAEGPDDPNSAFARAVASEDDSAQKASRIDHLQCKILPGRILEGQLQPRVISDLPGSITVVLDRDAFGEKGRIALLPWGTRITGKPNSVVRKGQERSFIATAVAYRPDGVTIHIDSPVADQLGSAGLDGDVDNHVGQILGMSAALSLLGAGSSTYGVSSSDQNNSMAMYRAGVQQSMAQSSQQLLGGYVNIPPTIKNDQGTRVRIQVERVLDFSDYCKPDEGGDQ